MGWWKNDVFKSKKISRVKRWFNRQEKPQVEEEDDFLSFMKKDKKDEKEVNLEDTLTEAKTFEQMREESSKELDRALKSAKESVGKQDEYNTRMDILNKIREPEKRTIKIDSVEDFATEEFSRGMFINQEKEEIDEEKPKEKMSLMEKLASMSPEEDAKKAEAVLNQEAVEEEIIEEEPVEEKVVEEEVVEEESDEEQIVEEQEDEEVDEPKESKVVKVMNVIIVLLVVIFIALLGMIVYQSFF